MAQKFVRTFGSDPRFAAVAEACQWLGAVSAGRLGFEPVA